MSPGPVWPVRRRNPRIYRDERNPFQEVSPVRPVRSTGHVKRKRGPADASDVSHHDWARVSILQNLLHKRRVAPKKKKKKSRPAQSHAEACVATKNQKTKAKARVVKGATKKSKVKADVVRASGKPKPKHRSKSAKSHSAAACKPSTKKPTKKKPVAKVASTGANGVGSQAPVSRAPVNQAPASASGGTPPASTTPPPSTPVPPPATNPPPVPPPPSGAVSPYAPPSDPVYAPLGATGGDTGWINVMALGAHGDGSADDTAAINAACNQARSVNVAGGAPVVYLPAGIYNVSGPINVHNVFLRGDGMGATSIVATRDWAPSPNGSWVLDQQPSTHGAGIPATSTSTMGPAPVDGTWIEDLCVTGPGQITAGQIPCNLSGIRVGGGAGYRRVIARGFFAGAFVSADATKILGPGKQGGNYYGIYYGGPTEMTSHHEVADVEVDGCGWASIGIGLAVAASTFRSLLLGQAPFGIYHEEARSGGTLLSGCLIANVRFDTCGNGNIFVNGPSGAGGDIDGCVFQATQSANAFSASSSVSTSTTDWKGRPVGRQLAPIDLLTGSWSDNEVQATDPTSLGGASGFTYTALIACGAFTGGRYGSGHSALAQAAQDGTLFTTGAVAQDALVVDGGTSCRLTPAITGGIQRFDVVEGATGSQPGGQRSSGTRRPLGVAMHAASAGDAVPVAYAGVVTINCGGNTISADDPLKADPSTPGCVVSTSLGDPAVIAVAQQPSSNGTVEALLQTL